MIENDPLWPAGWTRPGWGGWMVPTLLGVPGVLLTLLGLALLGPLVAGTVEYGWAAVVFCVGLGVGLAGAAFGSRPVGRRRARMVEIAAPGRPAEWGLAFDYSVARLAGMIGGLVGFLALGVVVVATSGETGARVVGWILVAIFLPLVVVGVVANRGRRVVLTPTRLVLEQGGRRLSVRWEAIRLVCAVEWVANNTRTRYVGLAVSDPAAIEEAGALMRRLLRANRMLGVDLALTTTCLAVAPEVLFATVERFHRDPAAREELTEAA